MHYASLAREFRNVEMKMQKPLALLRNTFYIGLVPLSFLTYQSTALAANISFLEPDVSIDPSECPIPLSYARDQDQGRLNDLISSFATNPATGLNQCEAVFVPAGTILNRYYSIPIPDPLNPTDPLSVNPGQFLTPNLFKTSRQAIIQLALDPALTPNTAKFRSTGFFNQDVTAFVGIVGPQGLGYPGGGTQYIVPSNFSFPQNNGILFTYVETLAAVPEPSTVLGAVACLGMGVGIKRIKRKLTINSKSKKIPNKV